MIVYYLKNDKVVLPQRANPDGDLGYDLVAISDPKIVGEVALEVNNIKYYKSIQYIEYDTDLYVEPQVEFSARGAMKKYHLFVAPRSSISKTNLLLANSLAIVDNGYRGKISLRYKHVLQPENLVLDSTKHGFLMKVDFDKIYKKGDRIGQLFPYKNIDIKFIEVDKLEETSRGAGGFGSTGK